MIHKNGEGYPDHTAADAIRLADKPPEIIRWYIRMVKELADLFDLEIIGRIQIREKKTGTEYR